MSGLISVIVAVAGFGPPQAPPAQRRRRAAPPRAKASQSAAAPGTPGARRAARPMSRMDENFGGPYVPPPAAAPRKAARTHEAAPLSTHRVRRVNGAGMLFLAMGCMGFGGWVGSHVQALAEGSTHAAAVVTVDPNAIVSTGTGPSFSF